MSRICGCELRAIAPSRSPQSEQFGPVDNHPVGTRGFPTTAAALHKRKWHDFGHIVPEVLEVVDSAQLYTCLARPRATT